MSYSFKNIKSFEQFEIDKTYLIMFHVDKVPPHLGMVVREKYYSITIKETEIGVNCQTITNLIKRKRIPTLILEIEDSIKNIESFYTKYLSLNEEVVSCLMPIKEYFASQYNFDKNAIEVVFDLLEKLEIEQKLGNIFQLNLNRMINENGEFVMLKYNFEDIENHINTLKQKQNSINV